MGMFAEWKKNMPPKNPKTGAWNEDEERVSQEWVRPFF